jgi:hypothetical protein
VPELLGGMARRIAANVAKLPVKAHGRPKALIPGCHTVIVTKT